MKAILMRKGPECQAIILLILLGKSLLFAKFQKLSIYMVDPSSIFT
jgi:hypothetical protein